MSSHMGYLSSIIAGQEVQVQPKQDQEPAAGRGAFWRAWSLWALTIGSTAVEMSFSAGRPLPDGAGQGSGANNVIWVAFIVTFATVGALLAWKRSSNPVGWLLSATALCYAAGGFGLFLQYFRPTLTFAQWSGWTWLLGPALTVFVLLLFPNGALPSRRWRIVAWVAVAGIACWIVGNAFAPTLLTSGPPPVLNPIGVGGLTGRLFTLLARLGAGVIALAGVAAVASLAFRYRRSGFVQREQLKWLLYATALIIIGLLGNVLVDVLVSDPDAASNLENALISVGIAAVPVAIGVAVFRYRLYDIDLVINKTLVYGSLAFFITGVYVAIVVGIGSFAQQLASPNLLLSIIATAVVAVAFHPVRERVQRLANWLVFGRRATPYEVLTELSGRMTGTIADHDLLDRMARLLAEGTGAVRADVWLRSGDALEDSAVWPPTAKAMPAVQVAAGDAVQIPADQVRLVRHQGEVLGALSLRKRPGERLTPTEDRMLGDLAAQAGLVLRNLGLTGQLLHRLEEVKASRQRLVAAQDEERRRIERNIHDGAQQQLVALAIKLTLTESLIGVDEEGERELLAELSADAAEAVENLRDLARGIYPPLLAERGLLAALRAQASKAPLPVEIEAHGLGRLEVETEAGLYFCVMEGLSNAVKYASASRITIDLVQADGQVRFDVHDDGAGFDVTAKVTGTGLQGIADRLAALGGALEVRSAPGVGTTIAGSIPLPSADQLRVAELAL
jgi:signal transduction histidine kinase